MAKQNYVIDANFGKYQKLAGSFKTYQEAWDWAEAHITGAVWVVRAIVKVS